jgi:hypothetical protein
VEFRWNKSARGSLNNRYGSQMGDSAISQDSVGAENRPAPKAGRQKNILQTLTRPFRCIFAKASLIFVEIRDSHIPICLV